MTNLLIVWFIVKVREVVGSLIVRNEVEQPQELAMNATRGRHARGQKRQGPIAVVRLQIGADFVSSSLTVAAPLLGVRRGNQSCEENRLIS